jgi:hypothetical protein
MAITVEDFDVAEAAEGSSSGSNDNEKGCEFVPNLPDDIRSRLHITVGTRYESIKPLEAKSMVEQWLLKLPKVPPLEVMITRRVVSSFRTFQMTFGRGCISRRWVRGMRVKKRI